MIHLHSDGAYTTRNKAAIFSWGYVIHSDKTELFSGGNCMTAVHGYDWLHAGSGYAEYLAIYEGLLHCKGAGLLKEDTVSYCDNQALVKHLNRVMPVVRGRAKKFYRGEVEALAKQFHSVQFKYIDRTKNRQAHHIATQYQRYMTKGLKHNGWHVPADTP